jgi:hypothetical protein
MMPHRAAALALLICGLAVESHGQSRDSNAPLPTSEKQFVIAPGRLKVESSAGGRSRIQLYLNTPTFLAKSVVLETDHFSIRHEAGGSILIESATPVRVTGFTVERNVDNAPMLQNAAHGVLIWVEGFKLRILSDGTPQWQCCPRSE